LPTTRSADVALRAELQRLRAAADFSLLPRAHGAPVARGRLRCSPEDFEVHEELGFEPSRDGEHLLLQLRKRGQNTRWVARRLAEIAGVEPAAVGYAGLKDRHAVAVQWFSLPLGSRSEPAGLEIDGVELLQSVRHRSKLRPGMHRGNRFRLRLRALDSDPVALRTRFARLAVAGVPNYFGPQRFGRDGANLELLTTGRRLNRGLRAFGLSALRAALFNGYLAMRITDGSWTRRLDGEITPRDAEGEPTGLLWGGGQSRASGAALDSERAWFEDYPASRRLLEAAGNRMLRRVLRVRPVAFRWELAGSEAELSFGLPRGAFATSLLREAGDFEDAAAGGGGSDVAD